MINIEPILLFLFVFSLLIILRTSTKFASALSVPVKFVMTDRERIINAIALSYLITYLLS